MRIECMDHAILDFKTGLSVELFKTQSHEANIITTLIFYHQISEMSANNQTWTNILHSSVEMEEVQEI